MGGVHNSHSRCFRGDVIPGKLGQDEIDSEGSGKYAHQRGKNPKKVSNLHRGLLVYFTRTYRVLKPHLKGLHRTLYSWRPYIDRYGWKFQGKGLLGAMCDGKNISLGRRSRTRICDGSPTVGKGPISPDQTHKLKTTKERIDKSQGQSKIMVYTGRYQPV